MQKGYIIALDSPITTSTYNVKYIPPPCNPLPLPVFFGFLGEGDHRSTEGGEVANRFKLGDTNLNNNCYYYYLFSLQ